MKPFSSSVSVVLSCRSIVLGVGLLMSGGAISAGSATGQLASGKVGEAYGGADKSPTDNQEARAQIKALRDSVKATKEGASWISVYISDEFTVSPISSSALKRLKDGVSSGGRIVLARSSSASYGVSGGSVSKAFRIVKAINSVRSYLEQEGVSPKAIDKSVEIVDGGDVEGLGSRRILIVLK